MSWVQENSLSFFQMFCTRVVKTGRVPQHIAFIMDGNRRFANKHNVKNSTGHAKGFDKLSETLKWCLDLGIPEVTVYAFSIENFKRTDEEVKCLMDLARDKFQRLLDETVQMNEWGVRVHVAGRLSLLPEDLRSLVSKAMLVTRDNNKLRLNIAYAYTGRDEISRAASHIVDAVENRDLNPEDIDVDLISQTLDLGEPELLVRTSGEVRLSDFMLWQVSNTVLYFTEVLWPEFTIWNFLAAIIHFQRHAPTPAPPPPPAQQLREVSGNQAHKKFMEKLEKDRWLQLQEYVKC